jgi:hypothetical protein
MRWTPRENEGLISQARVQHPQGCAKEESDLGKRTKADNVLRRMYSIVVTDSMKFRARHQRC